jgi:hypothetical protein
MYIDSRLEFSDAQALTATAASTNLVDLGADRNIGPGRALWVVLSIDVAADDTTGDETYVADLETDSTSAFSSATVIATRAIARGTAAGAKFIIGFPFANERWLRLNYTLGGTTPSVTLSAWLTDQDPESWAALPDAI